MKKLLPFLLIATSTVSFCTKPTNPLETFLGRNCLGSNQYALMKLKTKYKQADQGEHAPLRQQAITLLTGNDPKKLTQLKHAWQTSKRMPKNNVIIKMIHDYFSTI